MSEQLDELKRMLFGKRSEKLPPIESEVRRVLEKDELTIEGKPIPADPGERKHERRRKARKKSERQRKKKRGARKNLPVVTERIEVAPEALPAHSLLRKTESKAIIRQIYSWIDERTDTFPPRSTMGKALDYASNQRIALSRFLDDPKLPLDNNFAERGLRAIAPGRKNFLFAGHVEGAQNLAVLQSIVATCRLHSVNPHKCSSASSITLPPTSNCSCCETGNRRRIYRHSHHDRGDALIGYA